MSIALRLPSPTNAEVEAAHAYGGILRSMKRLGLEVDDMPDDVAQSMLALHQNAQMVWMWEHGYGTWEERKPDEGTA